MNVRYTLYAYAAMMAFLGLILGTMWLFQHAVFFLVAFAIGAITTGIVVRKLS